MKRAPLFSLLGLLFSLSACHSRALSVHDAGPDAMDAASERGAAGKGGGAAGTDGGAAGAVVVVADASSDADANAPDASLGRDPQCPDSPQNLKTQGCTPGFTCDYRAPGAYPTCIDRLRCVNANGGWSSVRSAFNCQKPTNDPSCPATFGALAQGTDCDTFRIGACTYDEGACGCNACSIGGLPTQGDWECQRWASGTPGCPSLPPLSGDRCAATDVGCSYPLGDDYACIDGVWQVLQSPMGLAPIPRCPQTLTCGFTTAPAAPDVVLPSAPAEQVATALTLAQYDALIGRYLRGDVTVYSGRFGARAIAPSGQAASVTPEGFQDDSALASVESHFTEPYDWSPPIATPSAVSRTAVLVVHSLVAPFDFMLAQRSDDTPDTTWFSGVAPDSATVPQPNYLIASCTGCLSSLIPTPPGFLINDVSVMHTQMVPASDGGLVGVSVLTEFEGQLDRVEPCSLRWKQLATLATTTGPSELAADPGLRGFADSGDEMVKHINSSFTDRIITPGTCGMQTSYTIDLWVKKADLGAHGVRNLSITSTQMICGA
jgi:hypothetical protein